MTNNLGAPTLTTSQTNKETTINDAIGQLDSAITEELDVTVSGADEDYAITAANLQLYARFTAVPDGGDVPAATDKTDFVFTAVQRYFSIRNEIACPVHVYISTTHYGMVMPGDTRWFYCDGSAIYPIYEGKARDSVRVVSTTNVTTSTALNSGDTIDGVTLAAGDRVLLVGQSTASQNGVWIVEATPYKSGEPANVVGARYQVTEGTYANKSFLCTATTPTFALAYYPYDLAAFFGGTPSVTTDIFVLNITRPFSLPVSLTGSLASLGTAPSGGAVAFGIEKNGTPIGSINFADASTSPTFTFATATDFVATDVLTITTPADLHSCANFAFTLKGQLDG